MHHRNIVHLHDVRVVEAEEKDVLQGWVRVPEGTRGGIQNKSFVKIQTQNQAIFCQISGTRLTGNIIQMNEYYRDLLSLKEGQVLDLDITPQKWIFSKIRALSMHPQHLVRLGFGFSLISVAIGIVALIISLLPIAIDSFGESWAWAGWVLIIFLLILAFFFGFLISAAMSMLKD